MGRLTDLVNYLRGARPANDSLQSNAPTSAVTAAPDNSLAAWSNRLAGQPSLGEFEPPAPIARNQPAEIDEEPWVDDERGGGDYEPQPPLPALGQCPTVDIIVARGMQRMTQYVRKDFSTAEKLAHANELDEDAAVEGGWDNYSTAARLRLSAEAHRLAAAISDWNAPQSPAAHARHEILTYLRDVHVLGGEQDEDVGEHTLAHRSAMAHAIGDIAPVEMERIIDELAATNSLKDAHTETLKAWHREAPAREAEELERWRSGLDLDDDLSH